MKIAILTNSSSGLYAFRKEALETLGVNHHLQVYSPDTGKVDLLKKMGCEFREIGLDRRGINPITDLTLLLNYQRAIKRNKPDLVITYTIKPNIYGGFICLINKIPYAVNITGLGTAFQKDGILKAFVIALYKVALKKAKVVFFENRDNQKVFIQNHILKQEQSCLLNGAGVNLNTYTLLPYPLEKGETHFLFIGRVMKEKGVEELFKAMQRLKADGYRCDLDVVGAMEEDYTEVLSEYVKEGWLNYYGFQSDVRPFIEKSHCFVLPSWHEGMANTNLECAASGRPIITSNIPGCREAVIENKSGFLCEAKNEDSLYFAMKKFMELSQDACMEMGLVGRKHMEAVFDKEKVVDETIRRLLG